MENVGSADDGGDGKQLLPEQTKLVGRTHLTMGSDPA
jgi:hypothetical protein